VQHLIGRVFASKGEEFVPDTSALSADRFPRLQHAKEFGIKSIGAFFCDGGVLEIGSTQRWSSLPKAMAAIEVQTVCQTAGAAYALFWEESKGGLAVSAKHVALGRALSLKTAHGDDESFVSKSCAVSLRPGEGVVGRVFASKGEELHSDVSLLSRSQFPRAAAAQEFGIVGLAAVGWKGGVLEFGSTQRWTVRPKVRIDMAARLKAVCSSSGAVYALFWEEGLFCEDALSVLEHYHPLERAIALRAKRRDDETTEEFALYFGRSSKSKLKDESA